MQLRILLPPVAQIELDLNRFTCSNYAGVPLAIEQGSVEMTPCVNHCRCRTHARTHRMENACSANLARV